MRFLTACASVLGIAFMVFASAGSANAQATRTWVSGVGNDANPCSRTAPCKTFAGAISKTAAGGEIDCLDPGGFGVVTITKAITIDCGTFPGGILSALSPAGVIVNAGVNDRIILRNLVINGVGTGTSGVRFLAGKELELDRVVIQQLTTNGIEITKSASGNVIFKDVSIIGVGVGIKSSTTVGAINGSAKNILIVGSTSHAVQAVNNTFITFESLNASRNGGDGVRSEAVSVGLNVLSGVIHGNNVGVNAVAGSIRIHDTTMVFNNTNLSSNVLSDGTNRSAGNTTTNAPTPGAFTIN